jgi:hypothetical protein
LNRADDSDSLPESLEIAAGLALRRLEWRFHLKPERGRYGKESQEEKSSEEEKEVTSLHRPGQRLLPGPNTFWGQCRS